MDNALSEIIGANLNIIFPHRFVSDPPSRGSGLLGSVSPGRSGHLIGISLPIISNLA